MISPLVESFGSRLSLKTQKKKKKIFFLDLEGEEGKSVVAVIT